MTDAQSLNASYSQQDTILPYNRIPEDLQVWAVNYAASGLKQVDLTGTAKCTVTRPFKAIRQNGEQAVGILELKQGMELPIQTGYRVFSDGGSWGGTNLQAEGFALEKVNLQLGDGGLTLTAQVGSILYLAFLIF